ncbi:MAG TPA: N(G),N(G)-dimethylarginine dimethylaminohydrolase [Gaiellaceae bacterium]|jgi:dimethylargininase|nr:N(G),N(G)-dimethylarginine dimethylaminohydrolase [Gaiellaceae bacterium]
MRTALVRRPARDLAQGLVTHVERRPVELELARAQWAGYVAALESAGWKALEVEPAEGCPDSVFVEDTLVVYRGLAVATRPGAPSRLAEVEGAEAASRSLGLPIARIEAPATLDGGDVLAVGETVYVGTGGRTNAGGVSQLRALLEPRGAIVLEVPVAGFLHLKSAVTALPDGTVVGYPPLAPDPDQFDDFLAVPEESGAHVVVLGPRAVLLAADCPRSAELYASLGYDPVVVEIGEFQKLEGCVTCLSVLTDAGS